MYAVFEPSGTHLENGWLKIRLDLYAAPREKSYNKYLVRGRRLTPSLSVFVSVGQDISGPRLKEWIGDVWPRDVIATIDSIMASPGHKAAHLISPYMRARTKMARCRLSTFDNHIKNEINATLANFFFKGVPGGAIERVIAQSIDVGPGAIDRAGTGAKNYAWLDKGNPANGTGDLDTVQLWFADGAVTACDVGTIYYVSGTTYTSRGVTGDLGAIASGSLKEFVGLEVAVAVGDFIGTYFTGDADALIEMDDSGGVAVLYPFAGNPFASPGSSASFNNSLDGYAMSIYGTGPGVTYSTTPLVVNGKLMVQDGKILTRVTENT